MKKIKCKLYMIIDIILHILPVSKNRVFFISFAGQYNDNPKYISEELHAINPNIKQYWAISEKSRENNLPKYIKTVKYNTISFCWHKNRSRVIVENGAGNYIYSTNSKFNIRHLLKNKKQFDISTWHGNPIKHIGAQIPGNSDWNANTFHSTSDMIICGCKYVKNIFEQAFCGKLKVRLMGTPRTDALFNITDSKKKKIKKKLGLPMDKKVILYAPTYRNNPDDSGVIQLNLIDFERLFAAFEKRFGGDWVFVFRVHNMVLLKIDVEGITKRYNNRIINGNTFDDMMEYMVVSDAMITDYSGCIFDNAHTNIPCFLFAHDRKKYKEIERGTYIELEKLPYRFSDTFDELINEILSYDSNANSIRVHNFQKYIGNIEDGKASKRVCKLILQILTGE